MTRRSVCSLLRLLAFGIIVLFAFLWRLPATDAEWQFTLCENDSLYQLYRVQQCLENYPLVPSVDRYSHFPQGYRVHWLAPHAVFYATVARLAGIAAGDRDRLIALLSWIPPLFGVLGVLLAMAITRRAAANPWCAYAVGFACAFSGETVRPFFFGTIDHHLFAHLGVLLLVLACLRRWRAGWILGLVALLGMTPEAIVYVSVFLGGLFLSELAGAGLGGGAEPRAPWFWYLSPSAVATCVWLAQRGGETAPLPLAELSWMYPTAFQPLWYAIAGGGMAVGLALSCRAFRQRRTAAARALVAAAAVVLVAAVCLVFLVWSGSVQAIAERFLGRGRIFVAEEASAFQAGFWRAPAWYRILAFSGIFAGVKLLAGVRERARSAYWFLWLSLAVALFLGLREFRHMYVLGSLQLVGLGLAVFGTERALRRLPVFSRRGARFLPAAALAAAVVPVFVLGDITHRAAAHGEVCARLPVTLELAHWLGNHTPDPAAAGAGTPAYGVFAPWSIGHQIHVIAARPVVVDPFNYELGAGVEAALDSVWQATSAPALAAALQSYGARYLVLINPAEEIVGSLRRAGVAAQEFVVFDADGKPTFRPAMSRFASFRLFMSRALSGEFGNLQPRFFSAETEVYTSRVADTGAMRRVVVPAGQIYEVKPGVEITGALPAGESGLTVSWAMRFGAAPPADIRIPIGVGDGGHFRFHTAMPAPAAGAGFEVQSGYVFASGAGRAVVQVTQEMVDRGARLRVSWAAAPSGIAARPVVGDARGKQRLLAATGGRSPANLFSSR